ncbi:MAG: FG-GAP repeat domain-containing protein, partial [Flavobacteriales bacterium]
MNYRICGLFIQIIFISFWSNAQFADPMLLNPGSRTGFFGYADLNNDGKEDIFGYSGLQFFIYPGYEDGFDHLIIQPLSLTYSPDLENQDINQDGYTDISLSSGYFPNVDFSLGDFITYPSIDASIPRTKLADIDGDDIPDIVRFGLNSSSPSTCVFHIFRNTGSGEFELINTFSATTNLSEYIRFIDMDADGLDDIVYKSNDVVLYQRNSGDGIFEEGIVLTDEYSIPEIGDWNNDQKMDYANFTSTGIEVYFQTTPDSFELIQQISLSETTSPLTNFAYYPQVDYNGDGFIDLAMRSQDDRMHILQNDGTGVFSSTNTTNHPHLNNKFRWDDLNNDQ